MKMFKVVSLSLALLVGLQPVAVFGAEPSRKTLKNRAIAQFDESVKRFKKCLHGDCSKSELLKVGRDVYLALNVVLGVAAVGYLAATAINLPGRSPRRDLFQVNDSVRIKGDEDKKYSVESYDPITKKVTIKWTIISTPLVVDADQLEHVTK